MAGGRIKASSKLGQYIEWPESFDLATLPEHLTPDVSIEMTTSSKLGKLLGVSATRINTIFSELGWINKQMKGWVVTSHGQKLGAIQKKDSRSGIPYIVWPHTIIKSRFLLQSIAALKGVRRSHTDVSHTPEKKHHAIDGHLLHSEAELLIDNWLYMAGIVHAHGRELPIEESIFCDFYIPAGNVYIEYLSSHLEPKSLARKEKKIATYKRYELNLIEITDQDLEKIDDMLPRGLLKFGIETS